MFPIGRAFCSAGQARLSSAQHQRFSIRIEIPRRRHLRWSTRARGQLRYSGFQPLNQHLWSFQPHGINLAALVGNGEIWPALSLTFLYSITQYIEVKFLCNIL
ncbi:unnamed protein product [Cuscuta epithymum]|uniref:Uncharacterized protein n=1 Tax=Cuscuta epithymum TaxID=186058 RepID=A0AAV0EUS9_9ASTE|nr:unnamed protein product [Cuscuta epithymum]